VEEINFIQHNALLERCKKGDKKAQFEIYKLYYKAMYNTTLRIVNNATEAEDLMQESFISAFSNLENYKTDASFGAWLKKIVINKALDFLKKRKLKFDEFSEKISITETDDFQTDMAVAEKVTQIKQAIMQLPNGFRIVLSLHLLEGYDHSEISEILNITPSASRSQFARGKQKLISILKEQKK